MQVFLLWHSYELNDCEETKLIGVYSTRKKAEQALERVAPQRGFCDRPEGFQIVCYDVDQDNWTEGYVVIPYGEV